jgi:DNA invertase Pin-like site-specific DNA recombinase
VTVYRKEGVSGTTDWENRPAFSEMMAAMLANGTRTVLVERLDRCARDLCSDDPSRVLMRQMLGALLGWLTSITTWAAEQKRQ